MGLGSGRQCPHKCKDRNKSGKWRERIGRRVMDGQGRERADPDSRPMETRKEDSKDGRGLARVWVGGRHQVVGRGKRMCCKSIWEQARVHES